MQSVLASEDDATAQNGTESGAGGPSTLSPHPAAENSLGFLTYQQMSSLLDKYSLLYPELRSDIRDLYAERLRKKEEEREKLEEDLPELIVDFEVYGKTIWQLLNMGFSPLARHSIGWSEPPEGDDDVEFQITLTLSLIQSGVDESRSFETSRNAAVTLCDIGNMVCTAEGSLRRVARDPMVCDLVPEILMSVLKSLDVKEKKRLRKYVVEPGVSSSLKLERLMEDASDLRIMEELDDCFSALLDTGRSPLDLNDEDRAVTDSDEDGEPIEESISVTMTRLAEEAIGKDGKGSKEGFKRLIEAIDAQENGRKRCSEAIEAQTIGRKRRRTGR